MASSLADRSFTLARIGLFGSLALLLAAPGIYGVISCTVGLRTREMGIRMALGAERGAILRMVLKDVLRLLAWGTGCGSGGQRGCPVWLCDLSSCGNRSVRKLTDRHIP